MKKLILLCLPFLLGAAVSHSPSSDGGVSCSSHPCTLAVTCGAGSCSDADIRTAISEAAGGDTITIQAGKVFTSTGSITLKSGLSSTVTIRTSASDSVLPASGVRITPAYTPLLPEIRLTGNSAPLFVIEKSQSPVVNYTFLGLWLSAEEGTDSSAALMDLWQGGGLQYTLTSASATSPSTVTMATTAGLSEGDHVLVQGYTDTPINGWWTITNVTATTVDLVGTSGNGVLPSSASITKLDHWDASQTPDHFVIDRCLFFVPAISAVRQAIRWGGRDLTVKNSYCDLIKHQSDSQCISLPSTPGPVLVENSYLGGGPGETLITGGTIPNLAGPLGTGQVATDVTVRRNALVKDPTIYKYEGWSAYATVRKGKVIGVGTPVVRYIALTSGVTGGVQPTFPSSLCPAPPATAPGCYVVDGTVTWVRNWFSAQKWTFKNLFELKNGQRISVLNNTLDGAWPDGQTGQCFQVSAMRQNPTGLAYAQNMEFGYNVCRHTMIFGSWTSNGDYGDGVSDNLYVHDNLVMRGSGSSGGGTGIINLGARSSTPPRFSGVRFDHNTIERNAEITAFWKFVAAGTTKDSYDSPIATNNLFDISGAAYRLYTSNCNGVGYPQGKAALDCLSNGGTYTFSANVVSGENLTSWPAGNYGTAWMFLGFTDVAHGDYTLLNNSPYKNAGTDGKDLGADTSQLSQIRGLSATLGNRVATLNWTVTAPESNQPCSVEVSDSFDFGTYIADQNPSVYTRPDVTGTGTSRYYVIGSRVALQAGGVYWFRLHCGGAFEQGRFVALPAGMATISGTAIQGSELK